MYIDGKNVLKINNRVSAKFIPVNFWFPTRQTYLAPTDLLIFWTFSKRQTYLGRHDYSELRSTWCVFLCYQTTTMQSCLISTMFFFGGRQGLKVNLRNYRHFKFVFHDFWRHRQKPRTPRVSKCPL